MQADEFTCIHKECLTSGQHVPGCEHWTVDAIYMVRDQRERHPPMQQPEPTAEQGQWRLWGLEPDGSRLYNDKGVGYYAVINEDNIEVALTYTLDRAKAIIADHKLVPDLLAALREIRYQASHGMYLSSQRRTELEAFIDAALAQAEASQPPETAT